jgi:hypothetical protein
MGRTHTLTTHPSVKIDPGGGAQTQSISRDLFLICRGGGVKRAKTDLFHNWGCWLPLVATSWCFGSRKEMRGTPTAGLAKMESPKP